MEDENKGEISKQNLPNIPRLTPEDFEKWIDEKETGEILKNSAQFKPASSVGSGAFFVPAVHKLMKSDYASEGFRSGDQMLLEPIMKINYTDRVLLKIRKKGVWICYIFKLPSGTIKELYEESKDKEDTVLVEKKPLSFISGNKFFIGSGTSVSDNTEIFHILGLYRTF